MRADVEAILKRVTEHVGGGGAGAAGQNLAQLEDIAVDILNPPELRLRVLYTISELNQKHSSAAKTLLASRNYKEEALLQGAVLDQAAAALFEAIALRKMTQKEQSAQAYSMVAKLLDQYGKHHEKGSIEIRIKLALDQAIAAFQDCEYLESARYNQKAASLAREAGLRIDEARANLNAAVSLERAGELHHCQEALEKGKKTLAALSEPTALIGSFNLFDWKLGIDYGPFPAWLAPQESFTKSQKALHSLYSLEYSLLSRSWEEIEAGIEKFRSHAESLQERQFKNEFDNLKQAVSFLFHGKKAETLPTLAEVIEKCDNRRERNVRAGQEGFFAVVAGWLCELFILGQWKKLKELSEYCLNDQHPVCQAWGLRSQGWLVLRVGKIGEAKEFIGRAITIAQSHNLSHLNKWLHAEMRSIEVAATEKPDFGTFREKKVFDQFLGNIPGRGGSFIIVSEAGRLNSELKPNPNIDSLIIDISCEQSLFKGRELGLGRKPLLQKIIVALIEAFPNSISKEDLISQVWEEAYNPLTHDSLFNTALSRLRRLLKEYGAEIMVEGGRARWQGRKQFWAKIPERSSRGNQDWKLNQRQLKILTLLKYRGTVIKGELLKALDISERTAVRDLADLVDRKMILRIGRGPATRYLPAQ